MKIILLKDIPKLGKKNEVKEVADGFARNVLIKKGQAVVATVQSLNKINNLEKQKNHSIAEAQRLFEEIAKTLEFTTLIIDDVSGSPDGHLFAGLHSKDIQDRLKKQTGIVLDEKVIKLDKTIKNTGDFVIKITNGESGDLYKEIDLKVSVTSR